MKQMLPFFSSIVLLAACNSQPQTEIVKAVPTVSPTDTAGLAKYQAWKAQNELATIAQYNAAMAAPAVAATPVRKTARTSKTNSRITTYPSTSQSGTMTSESENAAKAPEKKGWSKAAKGTAIGAGTGAVIGAVVNKKNRAVGGVIGGVAGGAVGYGIGRHMDKRDGRY